MCLRDSYYAALDNLTMALPLGIVNPAAFEGGVEKAYENCVSATMGCLLYTSAASLDVETEVQIQTGLNHLIQGKTVIVISHRLKSVSYTHLAWRSDYWI